MRTQSPRRRFWVAALTLACMVVPAHADQPTAPAADPLVAVSFSTGDPNAVVVQGEIKLHNREVDAFLHLLRTAFEAPIPQVLEAGLRKQMAVDFKARGILGRQAWLKLVDPWPQIAADRDAQRSDEARAGLQTFRLSLDKRLRQFPSARVHQLVARLLKRQNEILLPGPPEVTGLAADVYLDALVFVATLGRNEVVKLTEGQRSVLADNLREQFKLKKKDDHDAVRKVASAWNRVRAKWGTASKPQLGRTRRLAGELVYAFLPDSKKPKVTVGIGMPAFTRRAEIVRSVHGKLDTLSGLSANPTHVWNVFNAGLELGK